jgi:hypothetical protein
MGEKVTPEVYGGPPVQVQYTRGEWGGGIARVSCLLAVMAP